MAVQRSCDARLVDLQSRVAIEIFCLGHIYVLYVLVRFKAVEYNQQTDLRRSCGCQAADAEAHYIHSVVIC